MQPNNIGKSPLTKVPMQTTQFLGKKSFFKHKTLCLPYRKSNLYNSRNII